MPTYYFFARGGAAPRTLTAGEAETKKGALLLDVTGFGSPVPVEPPGWFEYQVVGPLTEGAIRDGGLFEGVTYEQFAFYSLEPTPFVVRYEAPTSFGLVPEGGARYIDGGTDYISLVVEDGAFDVTAISVWAAVPSLVGLQPGQIGELQYPSSFDLLRFDHPPSTPGWLASGPVLQDAAPGYEELMPESVYVTEYQPISATYFRIPDTLPGMRITFRVADPVDFAGSINYHNGDFSPVDYWQADAQPGPEGDPLLGTVEIFRSGAAVRVRYRRDGGDWHESDLTRIIDSWVGRSGWEDEDGDWRVFFLASQHAPSIDETYWQSGADPYEGAVDIPPGATYRITGWTLDDVKLFLLGDLPPPEVNRPDFWTGFVNSVERPV